MTAGLGKSILLCLGEWIFPLGEAFFFLGWGFAWFTSRWRTRGLAYGLAATLYWAITLAGYFAYLAMQMLKAQWIAPDALVAHVFLAGGASLGLVILAVGALVVVAVRLARFGW